MITSMRVHLIWSISIVLIIYFNSLQVLSFNLFTCQGTTYAAAVLACPDQGVQKASMGGNLTITVEYGMNLPNKIAELPTSKMDNPYVRFVVGGVARATKPVPTSPSPAWNENVNLGFLGSGTIMSIEIWNAYSGVLFTSKLLGSTVMNVPFCSHFNANESTVDCGEPFNCAAGDSAWGSPTRKVCVERGTINFTPSKPCDEGGMCIFITTTMVPFEMSLEPTNIPSPLSEPVLSVASTFGKASWTTDFGKPFISSSQAIDVNANSFRTLKGALTFRLLNSDKNFGAPGSTLFYSGINFPATIYICRYEGDTKANGLPRWIKNEFSSYYAVARQVTLKNVDQPFDCYLGDFPATVKNRWGGVVKDPIAFKANTIKGVTASSAYNYMYIILAIPNVEVPREVSVTLAYDASQFLSLFGAYGLINIWFIFLVMNFLKKKLNWRVDRLSSYFVSRVLTGKDRNLLAGLFLCRNQSPNNVEYRSYIFHCLAAAFFCFSIPFFLLMSWGMSCAQVVRPRGLGVGITFVGFAYILGYYGYHHWQQSNWRLSTLSLVSLGGSIFWFLIFLLIALFVDPNVLQLHASVNFAGLSLIFGTLNCVPCLLLIFKNDRTHQIYMSLVVQKITEAVHLLKQKVPSIPTGKFEKDTKINRILHALLGETYSINPKVPCFKYSTVIHEPSETYNSTVSQSASEADATKTTGTAADYVENIDLLSEERKLYGVAMVILFVYVMIAISSTQSPSLAFLNCCALILLDGIHLSMSKSDTDWSPGFKVVLLMLGRILICGSPQALWILNYSACYSVYSITLIYELINSYLPKLSKRKAGEIVFGGGDYQETLKQSLKTTDLSGSPGFCLLTLSVAFLAVLIVSAFLPNSGTDESALAVPTLDVLGSTTWQIYIFGLIAFLVTGIAGLSMATIRAFELEHHGLLRGWAKESYLFRRSVKVPLILAVSTEISILFSGMLIYAITKSNAVLVGCVYLPAIFFCLGYCLQLWMKNDFELIKWPRLKGEDNSSFWAMATMSTKNSLAGFTGTMKKLTNDGDEGGDLEVAFNIMENLNQAETDNNRPGTVTTTLVDLELDENPETQNEDGNSSFSPSKGGLAESLLKGFQLPALKPNNDGKETKEIKMPPLPLKSVLRRKRQNLAVKLPNQEGGSSPSKTMNQSIPLIQDLRARDNAGDKDQFGNKNDVIDLDDPWAQFEMNEEEEGLLSHQKRDSVKYSLKMKKLKEKEKERKKPLIRKIRLFFKRNKYMQEIWKFYEQAMNYIRAQSKIYPTNKYEVKFDDEGKETRRTGDDDDDDDEEEDNRVVKFRSNDNKDNTAEENDEDEEQGSSKNLIGRSKKLTSTFVSMNDGQNYSKKDANASPDKLSQQVYDRLNDDDDLDESDIAKLKFWDAFWKGYLNPKESAILYTWFTGIILIMMFGITLSLTVAPLILGFIVWISLWLLIFFGIPLYKYFQIYEFDDTSRSMMKFGFFVHVLFSLTFLFDTLYSAKYSIVDSIWMLDFLIYFPVFLYIIFNGIKWIDSGFKLALLDSNSDGQISFSEAIKFLKTFPSIMVMLVLLNWQLYLWINEVVGLLFTLSMLITGIAYLFIKDWAKNDYFLSPELRILGTVILNLTVFLSFMTAIFRPENPIFPLSVFIFAIAFKYILKIIQRITVLEKGTLFYFSPYIMPVYSYHTLNQDVQDEGELVKNCFILLCLGVIWGALLAVFYSPVNIGIAIACSFLLMIASAGALCSSSIPQELAKSNALLTAESIIETANYAKEKFQTRREPLNFEMRDFNMDIPIEILEDNEDKIQQQKTLFDKLVEKTSLENSLAIISDLRSLKYVKEDRSKFSDARDAAVEDQDEYELPWYQQIIMDLIKASKDFMRNVYELLPINKMRGWKKHAQAPFKIKDALLEVFFRGRGPYGFFGVEGSIYRNLKSMKGMGNFFERFYPKWTEHYDVYGNDKRLTQVSDYIDYQGILSRVLELDRALDFTYKEETRCAIHFLLMLLISAESKLNREQVLFQKFLRENRYRLATNGITPPRDIFSSTSFASINIPLVAIWISTLSKDEQDRFHLLKQSFNLEQKEKDEQIDQLDYEELMKAQDLKKQRMLSHFSYMEHIQQEIKGIKLNKVQEFQESLLGYEKQKFLMKKDLWINDPNCFVELKDSELYERFRVSCLQLPNEYGVYAQHFIKECETAQRDIRTGEYGRTYQFVDSEFPPAESSLGDAEATSLVLGWRCAPGIVENVDIFEGGTHPDDIMEGIYKDTWLLSAVSMIVAAGSLGQGFINEQIRRIFVTHPSLNDGEETFETETGVYGIQLHRNGEWIPILVDDLFPMRRKEQWTNENRGMACSHLKECRGLWLALIEKAFAKYYSSYTSLLDGYVHQALEDLTGCEAESIPLSAYSRGINKSNLWDRLLKYKRNGYILGAGTGSSEFVDKEILDMGINFNTSYTIYDVIQIDQHQLIKLRNPPGDHDSWKGDWSANSLLWSKRLKYKCNYNVNAEGSSLNANDAIDHNTFFMSFDDFLNIFRFLYVCKYYNPSKWLETKLNGIWKSPNDAELEQMELMHQFFSDAAENQGSRNNESDKKKDGEFVMNEELMNRKKNYAQLNTSGGLPSKHNPNCQLENNPHYSLTIYRPTDIKLSVTQYEGRYQQPQQLEAGANKSTKQKNSAPQYDNIVIPFIVLIIKNPKGHIPHRLTSINKDDIIYSTGEPQYEKTLNIYANNILPGDYLVLVAPYINGMEGKFRLTVLSNYRIDSAPIWPPAWMLKDGDIFNLGDEKLEDKMKRNFVKSSNVAKENMNRVNLLFRSGMRQLLGANSPFDDDSGGEESEDDGENEDEENKADQVGAEDV
jgi:hypothetical protein